MCALAFDWLYVEAPAKQRQPLLWLVIECLLNDLKHNWPPIARTRYPRSITPGHGHACGLQAEQRFEVERWWVIFFSYSLLLHSLARDIFLEVFKK